jgi:hypothetical protein
MAESDVQDVPHMIFVGLVFVLFFFLSCNTKLDYLEGGKAIIDVKFIVGSTKSFVFFCYCCCYYEG